MKLALITGSGMDSKTLAHLLLSKNYRVVLTYRRNTKQIIEEISSLFKDDLIKYPNSRLNLEFMDITDFASVRNAIRKIQKEHGKIDELYSLAAQSHVGDSFLNVEYTMQASGVSVYYLLESIREFSPYTKFYQASTSEMFGGKIENCPFNEKSPFELRSPYSISKNLAFNWVQYYRDTYGIRACSGFLFNHSNYYRNVTFYCRKVTNTAAKIALGKANEIVCGNIEHWRDEHFADFGVEAMFLMNNNELGPIDYVISSDKCFHGTQYLDEAFSYFNLDWKKYIKIDDKFKRPNEVVKLLGDSSKAKKELGWKPHRMPFKDHIGFMCKYDYELESGKIPIRPNVFELYP